MCSARFGLLFAGLVSALCCSGREVIYLKNGFTLECKSHVLDGNQFILTTETGTLEMPASDVGRVERLGEPAGALCSTEAKDESAEEILQGAARTMGLPPEFVHSVARMESGMRQTAVSNKGAVGLMQLMPGTAAALGVSAGDARENARGGTQLLRELLIRYHGDAALALAAYNAGSGSVEKYHGIPPYAETRAYVLRVLKEYARQQALAKKSAAAVGSVAPAPQNSAGCVAGTHSGKENQVALF